MNTNPEHELDHLFDGAMTRMEQKSPSPNNPYGLPPAAADHFLLNKSWDYFKSRLNDLERHWKEIVDAKSKEIEVLNQKCQHLSDENQDVRGQAGALESYVSTIRESWVDQFKMFEQKTYQLKCMWEEERSLLEQAYADLDYKRDKEKRRFQEMEKFIRSREAALLAQIEKLKADRMADQEHFSHTNSEFKKIELEKDSYEQSLEAKIDLLKKELNRRDRLIAYYEQKRKIHSKFAREKESKWREQQQKQLEQSREIENLKTRLSIFHAEKENIRLLWEQEKAEWRDLWERSREIWEQDHKKKQ